MPDETPEVVTITIADSRNGQTASINLPASASDAILHYIMEYIGYAGNNPMEAAVEFFKRQGEEVAQSAIRRNKMKEAEDEITAIRAVIFAPLEPESPPEEPIE